MAPVLPGPCYRAIYSVNRDFRGDNETSEKLVRKMGLVLPGVLVIAGPPKEIGPDKAFQYLFLRYEKYIAQVQWDRIISDLVRITNRDAAEIDAKIIQIIRNLIKAKANLQDFLQDWHVKYRYFPQMRSCFRRV